MQVMQFTAYGGPEKLRLTEIPAPIPDENQVLVRVHATSINPIDWKLHNGMLHWVRRVQFPAIPCFDFAGEIAAVGPAVAGKPIGTRVFGMLPVGSQGAAAEYVTLPDTLLGQLPPTLDYLHAAGMPLAGMTALQAIRDDGGLQPDQTLLVVGASGGVGHYAVQIGKALGASVTAVCSQRNADFVRQLGADEVLDYTSPAFQLPRTKFNVILDAAVQRPIGFWLPALARQGTYVTLLPGIELAWRRMLEIFGQPRVRFTLVRPCAADLALLARLAERGNLKTHIDQIFSLPELGLALTQSQGQRVRGKLILAIDQRAPA